MELTLKVTITLFVLTVIGAAAGAAIHVVGSAIGVPDSPLYFLSGLSGALIGYCGTLYAMNRWW